MPHLHSPAARAARHARALARGYVTPRPAGCRFVPVRAELLPAALDMTRSLEYHFAHQNMVECPHHFARHATMHAQAVISPKEFSTAMKLHSKANKAKHVVPLRNKVPEYEVRATPAPLLCPESRAPCPCPPRYRCREPMARGCSLSTPTTPSPTAAASPVSAPRRVHFAMLDETIEFECEDLLAALRCDNCNADLAVTGCASCSLCRACGECPCDDHALVEVEAMTSVLSGVAAAIKNEQNQLRGLAKDFKELDERVRNVAASSISAPSDATASAQCEDGLKEVEVGDCSPVASLPSSSNVVADGAACTVAHFNGIVSSMQHPRFMDKLTKCFLKADLNLAVSGPPLSGKQRRAEARKRVRDALLEEQAKLFD